jgi:hypothetical protein
VRSTVRNTRIAVCRPAAVLIALVALVLAGCGPEIGTKTAPQVKPGTPRIGPPPVKESLAEAEARIAKAASAKDCAGIFELVPTSRPSAATQERCTFEQRLDGLPVAGDAEYEDQAAIIDYDTGPAFATVVLIRDDDGFYHLAILDFTVEEPASQTDFNRAVWDKAATEAIDAVRERSDCDRYLAILDRRFGLGSASEPEICPKLERDSNLFANAVASDREAKPELIGGNGEWAFYGLSTAFGYYMLVFAHQPPSPTHPDAAPYAFVDAYLTNPAK